MIRLVRSLALAAFSIAAAGCATEEVTALALLGEDVPACGIACDRFQDCVDPAFDTGFCTEVCLEQARSDADYSTRLDACAACAEPLVCEERPDAYPCAEACAGVVP